MTGLSDDFDSVPGVGPSEFVFLDVPARGEAIGDIRHALLGWLGITDFDDDRTADISLAVYEAMANVVEHAYRGVDTTGTMDLRAGYSTVERVLQVVVVDHGIWQSPEWKPMRGNGVPLMSALCDELSIDHSEAGTSVLMHWLVDRTPGADAQWELAVTPEVVADQVHRDVSPDREASSPAATSSLDTSAGTRRASFRPSIAE
jgi:serine/threonine-protein kinase RsbW